MGYWRLDGLEYVRVNFSERALHRRTSGFAVTTADHADTYGGYCARSGVWRGANAGAVP